MKPTRLVPSLALALVGTTISPAHGGVNPFDPVKKYFIHEVIPTITGERPLEIKDYISVKHGDNLIKIGFDSAEVRIAGVTVKTHQLTKRLAQFGCIVQTGGNVIGCAPDIVAREIQNLATEERNAGTTGTNTAPRAEWSQAGTNAGWSAPETGWRAPETGSQAWARGAIFARCQLVDGTSIALADSGYVHGLTSAGMGPPVGFVRPSRVPLVRYFLYDARGSELVVDPSGRVIGPVGAIGQCT